MAIEQLETRRLLAAELLGLGHGLAADYYSDPALANLASTRIDPQVNFNWGDGSPMASLPADGFSVRWNGKFQAQYSETYTFYTTSAADDGVRLTVTTTDLTVTGGRKANTLVDTWANHTAAEQNGTLAVVAGETYDMVVEYSNSTGSANLALRWSSPTTTKALIPNAQLYPTQSLAVSSIGGSWLDTDLGTPAMPGTLASQGKNYTLTGSGSDIGGTSDQCHFAYQVLQGDGIAIVKVDGLSGANIDPGAQVGVMVRDGTAAGGLYAGMFLTRDNGLRFGYRTATGQAATVVTQPGITAPYWLKLVRRGPTLNGYVSATGADDAWTFAGRADIKGLGDAVLIGVAAAANNSASAISARLTNVRMATDVPVAGGLGYLATYNANLPFIDLVRAGCGRPMKPDASGTFNQSTTYANVDSDGWPTEDFGYKGPYLQKPDAFTGRSCLLTFTGKATVSVVGPGVGTATPASASTGDPNYVGGYNIANNTSKWYLATTDTSGQNGTGICPRFQNTQRTYASATNTGVTNIQLLQPGYTSYDNQHVFTQEWLDLVKPINEVRLENWAMVDGNLTADWWQRTLPSAPNQMGFGAFQLAVQGVAWEYLVQFCNLAHKDMWLSIPAHVTNDYILKLAQLFRFGSDGLNPYTSPQSNPIYPGLDPDLNVYVEYSNEVWNGTFEANSYAQSQAWAAYQAGTRYGPKQVTLGFDGRTWSNSNNQDLIYRWFAAHLKQDIVDTFAQVFGSGAINARIRPVLSGWNAYPDRTNEEGLKLMVAAGWPPKDSLYAITDAAYYGYNDLAAAQVTTNATRDTATKEEVLQNFSNAATVNRGNLTWSWTTPLAAAYGLKLVAYEGGPSLGVTNAQASVQMDPQFAAIQTAIINSWFASGAEQYNFSFFYFTFAYGNSVGDFCVSDNRWDLNQPRGQSILDLSSAAASTPPVIDGFANVPSGELEARNYVNDATPDPIYMVAPSDWEQTRTYRYMVRSLVDQNVDLRLSLAAAAAGDRVKLSVNGVDIQTYDFASAASRDPANYFIYSDTAARTIHLNPGINMIDLVLSNPNDTTVTQYAKARLNSLKFSPVGGSLSNTMPWAYNLPGNPQSLTSPQTMPENTTYTVYADIQDQETPVVPNQPSPFTVTAISDNPTLVANDSSHLSVSYNSGLARYLVAITPTANMTGKFNLKVTVTDAGGARRTWTTPINVMPAVPTSVTAAAADDGTVTVAWTNNSRINPTFKIERSFDINNGNAWVQVGLTGATPYGAATWTDKPPGGASYYYRISGSDANGVSNYVVYANSNVAVAVPTGSTVGTGLSATNLFSGKTYFASSTDTINGGRSVRAAFDGTSQYFSLAATSNNFMAVTGMDGSSGIDTLKFYYPAGVSGQRMPAVSIYYSASDYSGSQSNALGPANYARLGTSSYTLYQAGAAPVITQPDGVQVTTLSGLAIPAGTRSVLLAFDASPANPYLAEVQAFAATGLAAPTGVSYSTAWIQLGTASFANYVGATVTLSWTNPNAATVPTSFVIQRDTTSNFSSANLRTWNTSLNVSGFLNDRDKQEAALNPYAHTWDSARNVPLPAGTTYYYRVGTRQTDGSVLYAAPVTVITPAATYATATPTGPSATAVSDYQISLSWNAVPGATAYKIEKSTRSDFADTNYAMAQVTVTSYSDPTVTPNSVWYYRVRAVGAGGDSDWATASATAQAITSAPTNLIATANEGTIRLAWTRPMGKIYAYEIYRGMSPTSLSPYKTFSTGSGSILTPEFLDTGLADNATYYYTVRGVFWSNNANPSTTQYTAQSNVTAATTLRNHLAVAANDWVAAGLTLKLASDGRLHVYRTGTTTDAVPSCAAGEVLDVRITGRDGSADALTIDLSGGVPLPIGGIVYDGGLGSIGDSLVIADATRSDTWTMTATQLSINASVAVTYSHTQLLTLDLGSGTLNLGGNTQTVGGITLLSGSIVNGTLVSNGHVLQSGDIHSSLSGSGGLQKIGAGTVTLFAANDYTGDSTVSAGTLVVANANALPATGSLNIGTNGTVVLANGLSQAIALSGLSFDTGVSGPGLSSAGNEGTPVSTGDGSLNAPTGSVWRNPTDATDVNGNGVANSLDELAVVQVLPAVGPRQLPALALASSLRLDVNGDGMMNWLDALVIHQQFHRAAATDALFGAVVLANSQESSEPVAAGSQPVGAVSVPTTLTETPPTDLSLIAADVWQWRGRVKESERPAGAAPWASLMPSML